MVKDVYKRQEFIRIIRLQKAAELLKEGKSVTDVAAETGFVNTKYFSSLFKKQFGMQDVYKRQAQIPAKSTGTITLVRSVIAAANFS